MIMVNIKNVISSLKEKEKFYIENYQPEWMFADEVISELSKFDVSEYDIFDIFSTEVIENYILVPGKDHLIANLIDGKVESYFKANIGDAKVLDHSDLTPLYLKVFKDWEKAGWIKITSTEGSDKTIAIELNINN